MAGVLAYCGEPGEKALYEWIAADPRYNPRDDYVAKKLDQWAKTSGPTTCTHFSALKPEPCSLCPYRGQITSPIQLGRSLPTSVTAPAPPGLVLPSLPRGFKWVGMKLCAEHKPTEDDPSDHHIVTDYPVAVATLQETERTKRVSALFRSWEPMAGAWREFVMGMGELKGQGGAGKIADHGVVIPKKRWDRFLECVDGWSVEHRGSKHYGTRYEQFGWKGDKSFVLGEHTHRQGTPPARVYGTDEVERRGRMMAPQGDALRWTEAANRLIGHAGMEAHAFMLLCAFAAPLYAFAGEPGVTFVHGATRSSGKGKSAILDAGMWVWGERDATSLIERDTMVAKFITLGTLCHLPVFFDELRFPTIDETKHYVLQATLGRDKQRGKAEGGLRADQLTWATIHLSAANLSLMDTVRADGAEVAQAARIFEFTLDLPPGIKTTDGDALKRARQANRGTAGRAFIQAVLDKYDWVAAAVPARMRHYESLMSAGPDERFILRLFACVDVAGAIVKGAKLLDFDLDATMRWAVSVQSGNAGRLKIEGQTDAAAIISEMLNDLKAGHLLVVDRGVEMGKPATLHAHLEPRAGIQARFEREGRRLLVDLGTARKWMQEHKYSFTEIQKELQTMGILKEPRVRKTLGAGTEYTLGQTWCWLIDASHPLLVEAADGLGVESNVVQLRGKA